MTDHEKIIDKLKKLYAHAESAKKIGSEKEAQAFAAKFQELLNEHKLEMNDIQWEQEKDVNPICESLYRFVDHGLRTRSRNIPWLQSLASCVAWANFCQILILKKTTDFYFVGRKSDCAAAAEIFTYLVNAAENIADKEYVKFFYECQAAGDVTRARGFRNSFLEGFVSRMSVRYHEEMDKIYNDAIRGKCAIVRFKDLRTQVQEFIDALFAPRATWKVEKLGDGDRARIPQREPALLLRFDRGRRWAITSHGRVIRLYTTEAEAVSHLGDEHAQKNTPKAGKTENLEGKRRGCNVADGIKIGRTSNELVN